MAPAPERPPTLAELRSSFAAPHHRQAPMMRWWWFGPAVERSELDRQLTAMARAGLGGVEVAYVYPFVEAAEAFLSPPFLSLLRFAAERAAELDLRFDLTLGSGWSFGGPHIDADHAARQLSWDHREIGPDPVAVPLAAGWPGDAFVAAFVGPGSLQDPPESFDPLPVVDGVLDIPAGAGVRRVLIAWSRPTGQSVKRAAVGAEGPVLDHYCAAATRRHLHEVGDRLLDAVPAELIGSVFCDSLEVYGADWTPDFVAEFRARRGYELLPQLFRLVVDAGDREAALALRADVGRTLAELYEENFLQVVRGWAAGRGVKFRVQSYGAPPALISSARHADLIEGEGWGWTELTQTKWASSAAHLHHRPVVSSEVWTWVHSPSFRATPLDLKGEAHQHLLAGINAFVGHGWPYSPADAPGVGWIFYAAGALDDRNPWWPAMTPLSRYLARLCGFLRQGEPVTDVLVHVSDEDVLSRLNPATGGSLDPWREARSLLDPAVLRRIRAGGWDYDLVDDAGLSALPETDERPVLLVGSRRLSTDARAWLEHRLARGGLLIGVGDPAGPDSMVPTTPDRLSAVLLAHGIDPVGLEPPQPEVGVVRRRIGDLDGLVVVNTAATTRSFRLRPASTRTAFEQWDPDTGTVLDTGRVGDGIALQLEPYQAAVLVLSDATIPVADRQGQDRDRPGQDRDRQPLDRGWTVQRGATSTEIGVPHCWQDVPDWPSDQTSVRYRISVDLTPAQASSLLWLDFGPGQPVPDVPSGTGDGAHSYRAGIESPVGTAAEVLVNGVRCGVIWSPPFRAEISQAARAGTNLIEVVVHGSAAQRLAADHRLVANAAVVERRHGRRARMQDLDRATDELRSGLLSVPVLIASGSAPRGAGPSACSTGR